MKKLFKKVIPAILSAAMALSMMMVPVMANDWSDGTVWMTGSSEFHTAVGLTGQWDPAAGKAMTWDGSKYTVSLNVTQGEIYEFQFLGDQSWSNKWQDANFKYEGAATGSATITLDPSKTGTSAVSVSSGLKAPSAVNWSDGTVWVTGSAEFHTAVGLTGQWDPAAGKAMTWDGSKYTVSLNVTQEETYEFQFLADQTWSNKWQETNFSYTATGTGTLTITLDPSKTGATAMSTSLKEATANAGECEAAISAIGTVALTKDCWNKIEAAKLKIDTFVDDGGSTSSISNYATYTAAVNAFDKLVDDAAGAVTLYVKPDDTTNWTGVAAYTFPSGGATGNATGTMSWPGIVATADANNAGWFKVTFEISGATTLIINNNNNAEQTPNIEYLAAGTYWITNVDQGVTAVVSTTAPTGWSTGSSEGPTQGPTQAPTTAPSGTTAAGSTTEAPSVNNGGQGGSNVGGSETGTTVVVVVAAVAVMLAASVAVIASKKKVEE